MVADLNPIGSGEPSWITVSNDILFFQANDGTLGFELYKLEVTADIVSIDEEEKFILFPNPAEDVVYLQIGAKITEDIIIEIVDASGKIIKFQKVSNAMANSIIEIDVQVLPSGTYFVNIVDKEGNETTRRMIKD